MKPVNLEIVDSVASTDDGRIVIRQWLPAYAEMHVPIVLLHDSLGCIDLWRTFPQELALATGRPVVAYDRLGFGRSAAYPPSKSPLGINFVQEEANGNFASVLNHLAIKKFIAFGHSIGAGMALAIAASYQASCLGVISESAQTFVEEETLDGIRSAKQAFTFHDQMEKLRKYHGEKSDWVVSAWTDTWLDPRFASWSLDHELPVINSPVLIIRGTRDEFGSSEHARKIESFVKGGSSINELDGVGHVPHREAAETVLKLVGEFLKKIDP